MKINHNFVLKKGYSMSSSANLTKKLDFLFKVYDTDNDGHILVSEIVKIIEKMTKLCGKFFKLKCFKFYLN